MEAQQFDINSRPYPPGVVGVESEDFGSDAEGYKGIRFFLETGNGSARPELKSSDWVVTDVRGIRSCMENDAFQAAGFDLVPDNEQLPTSFVSVNLFEDGREALINLNRVVAIEECIEPGASVVELEGGAKLFIRQSPRECFLNPVFASIRRPRI